MSEILEPARKTPVTDQADVVVCGGGPAGVSAAIASARAGARTILVERHGCLGGIWTAGVLSWFLDSENKGGLVREILNRAHSMGACPDETGKPGTSCDVEKLKLLLETLCLEAGVQINLYTHITGTVVEKGRVTHILTESKSGREALEGACFIDATGDGDVACQAGCGFDLGRPEDGKMQPMSMIMLVSGLNRTDIDPFLRHSNQTPWAKPKELLRAEMERSGHTPSYAFPTLMWLGGDLFMLMANHEYGMNGLNTQDLTTATLKARRELHGLIDGLRSLGGIWKNIRLVATGAQIGVREGRRIHGLYTVTADDLKTGKKHPDAICHVTFCIDVHSLTGKQEKGIEHAPFRSLPYDIPLRALIAKDVTGLLLAGRCISGDFLAHSSYRVTGNASVMGEAAGRVAAQAALTGQLPHQITWPISKPSP
jgi:hypothetical protein